MKYYELDKEEQATLDAFERALTDGTLEHAPNFAARKKQLQLYARSQLNKTRNVNIRLSERDLIKLKSKAVEEGLPYQTLMSSILHKAV